MTIIADAAQIAFVLAFVVSAFCAVLIVATNHAYMQGLERGEEIGEHKGRLEELEEHIVFVRQMCELHAREAIANKADQVLEP